MREIDVCLTTLGTMVFIWAAIKEANQLDSGHMFNTQRELLMLYEFSLVGKPGKAPQRLDYG